MCIQQAFYSLSSGMHYRFCSKYFQCIHINYNHRFLAKRAKGHNFIISLKLLFESSNSIIMPYNNYYKSTSICIKHRVFNIYNSQELYKNMRLEHGIMVTMLRLLVVIPYEK